MFLTIIINGTQEFYTFILNKSVVQLLEDSHKNFVSLKMFNLEFSYIEVWFTDQNSKPLEIEDKINITLAVHPGNKIFLKG